MHIRIDGRTPCSSPNGYGVGFQLIKNIGVYINDYLHADLCQCSLCLGKHGAGRMRCSLRRESEGKGDRTTVLIDDFPVNLLIIVGHQEHFLRFFSSTVKRIHILRVLRIRPRNLRHRSVNDLRQAAGIHIERQLNIHRVSKRSSCIQIGYELGIDADIAIAEIIDEHMADIRSGELIDVLGAGLRIGIVNLAVKKVVDLRPHCNGLIAKILDIRRAEHKVIVRHKVNDAIRIELGEIGRHIAGAVAGDIGSGAHRDNVLFDMLLELGAVELYAEILLAVRRGGQLRSRIVMHRRNLN